jgi:crotonobetainyl-CoA:carnitine CoA-transferase CaiB-like acyl-CoA transferase
VQGGSAQRLPVADAPLAGIRIIDFGAFVAGPMVSVSLGDLGADVVKVEPPGGDLLRGLYKFFAGANRGKRCIAIEMKSEEGRSLAHSLVRDADIICSNFRGGVAERLGIDARSIHASQPDKIVVLNPGYGIAGPQVNDPAFDPCMQATCGHEVRAGGLGNPPVFNPMMMIDLCGGQLGAIGTLMALYRRLRDGSGATVTVPLLNAGMFLMSDIMRTADGGVLGPQHLLSDQTGYHPAEKLYQAQDGWIAVAARGEAAARAFGQACGVTSISRKSRHEWDEADMKALARAIGQLTVDAALELLRAAGVPAERCCETGARDYLCDDFNVAAGRVYEANRRVIGKTRGLGVLFAMSRARLMPSGELGGKGEDSRAIMAEAGLSLDQIQDLISRCIVVEN